MGDRSHGGHGGGGGFGGSGGFPPRGQFGGGDGAFQPMTWSASGDAHPQHGNGGGNGGYGGGGGGYGGQQWGGHDGGYGYGVVGAGYNGGYGYSKGAGDSFGYHHGGRSHGKGHNGGRGKGGRNKGGGGVNGGGGGGGKSSSKRRENKPRIEDPPHPPSALLEDYLSRGPGCIDKNAIIASQDDRRAFAMDAGGADYLTKLFDQDQPALEADEDAYPGLFTVKFCESLDGEDIFVLSCSARGHRVLDALQRVTDERTGLPLLQPLGVLSDEQVIVLACHGHGCWLVQCAVEVGTHNTQVRVANVLAPKILELILDMHGNHVVQKTIEFMPAARMGLLVDPLRGKCRELAGHAYGCRVLQRVIEFGSDMKQFVLEELTCSEEVVAATVQDQFGNYVLQHVLEQQDATRSDAARKVDNYILANVEACCRHKYASNVVEKALKESGPAVRRGVLRTLLALDEEGREKVKLSEAPLRALICDKYGNYVVQALTRAAQSGEGWVKDYRDLLHRHIRAARESVRHMQFGKRVLALLPDSEE